MYLEKKEINSDICTEIELCSTSEPDEMEADMFDLLNDLFETKNLYKMMSLLYLLKK